MKTYLFFQIASTLVDANTDVVVDKIIAKATKEVGEEELRVETFKHVYFYVKRMSNIDLV